jgi:hypothetical protein
MADRAWWMEVGYKVHILDRQVGGQDNLLPGWDLYQCGVITDAQCETHYTGRVPPADRSDKIRFTFEKQFIAHPRIQQPADKQVSS